MQGRVHNRAGELDCLSPDLDIGWSCQSSTTRDDRPFDFRRWGAPATLRNDIKENSVAVFDLIDKAPPKARARARTAKGEHA